MQALNRVFARSLKEQGVDYRRRSRILVDTTVAILVFNLLITGSLVGPLQQRELGFATAIALAVGAMVLPALRFTGSVTVAGNVLLCQIWALLHVLTIYIGEIHGVPPAWIIFLPLLAVHICNKRSSALWTVLAVIEILFLGWLGFQAGELAGGSLFLYLCTHLGLLALMVSSALLDSRFKERTLQRLSRTNRELSVARDRALEGSRAKSSFVANMSHELRTPLNAVIGYADLLSEDVDGCEPEQLKQDLSRISSSGQHLLRLINELLEFSRLEAGRVTLSLESFRLELLIRELMATMEQQAVKNRNSLEFVDASGGELEVRSDATRLRQCLYNLLSNACKFTEDGEIFVELERVGEERFSIEVRDSGIGMTEEQLERVFEPFVQAEESISRRFGGTGLGLSLSRRLAESLQGELTAASVPGEGSSFRLEFPINCSFN